MGRRWVTWWSQNYWSWTDGLAPCRMHLALKAYQELLLTVNEMDSSPDENIRQSSNVIKSESLTVGPQLPVCCVMFHLPFPLFPRQHLLPDGVPGDLPDSAQEVWWNQTASVLPQRPCGVHAPLPAHAGALLQRPQESHGSGKENQMAPQIVEES